MVRKVAWVHADEAKARKPIRVPLNSEAVEALRNRMGKHIEFVFTYRDKRIENPNTKAWKKALRTAGIENFRWHDLRHTWASWHVQSGTSLQELMELGGWASYEMVLRYAHLASDHLAAAAERVVVTNLTQTNSCKLTEVG